MTVAVQPFWMKADWGLLKKYIADPTKYPAKIPISHLHFEDLRKLIWLLDHEHAGSYSENFPFVQPESSPPATIHKYRGDWTVTTYDPVLERWLFWKNLVDVYHGTTVDPPPCHETSEYTTIEPYHTYPAWKTFQRKADDVVQYSKAGKAYIAKINIDEEHAAIPPPDYTAGWEEVGNLWVLQTATWQLAPSPNYYYDWDKNAGGKEQFYELEEIYSVECYQHLLASAYYPIQVDPKEQLPPVIYQDTGKRDFQYKGKVPFAANIITDPTTLKPNFTSWRFGQQQYGSIGSAAWKLIVCQDGNQATEPDGTKRKQAGSFPGDQYGNAMGGYTLAQANSPPTGEFLWTDNPAINGALQNKIMVALSSGWQHPADDAYKVNWRLVKGLAPDYDVEQSSYWNSYPLCNDPCWGENESGYELYLRVNNSFDWVFDAGWRYFPSVVCSYITDLCLNHGLSWTDAFLPDPTGFDLNTLKGTWRRTFKYTFGRPSVWMRDSERAEPSRCDEWTNPKSPMKTGAYQWFGARSTSWPQIKDFDTNFSEIVDSEQDHIFTIAGDITDDLKAGWMVHFCDDDDDYIKDVDGENELPYAYVLSCVFDGTNTIVTIDRKITGYDYIGWNPNISIRHDPSVVSVEGGSPQFGYTLKAASMLCMDAFDLLQKVSYIKISPSLSIKQGLFYAETHSSFPSIDAMRSYSLGGALKVFDYDVDENPYWQAYVEGVKYVDALNDAGCDWGFRDGEWRANAEWGICLSLYAIAIKFTWPTIAGISNLPDTIMIRVLLKDVLDRENYGDEGGDVPQYPQYTSIGGTLLANNIVHDEEDVKYRYKYIALSQQGMWHFALPKLKQPPYKLVYKEEQDLYFWAGRAYLGDLTGFFTDAIVMKLDWDKTPETVFERQFIPHIDAPLELQADTNPPYPNPALFNILPYVYFKHAMPYGTGKITDYTEWEAEAEYSEGDYVTDPATAMMIDDTIYYKLYQAKQNIEDAENNPSWNPEEWEWIPYYFEMRISANICLCEDYEGNDNPIKYQMVEKNNSIAPSGYLATRAIDIWVKDIELPASVSLTGSTTNPSGTITRIPCSGTYTTGDIVMIRGSIQSEGIWEIVGVGSGYFEIDKGWYIAETFTAYAVAYNLNDIYEQSDWLEDSVCDYEFSPQAKDSATPINNETMLKNYGPIIEAEMYPLQLIQESEW